MRQICFLGCMLIGAVCFAQTTDSFEAFKRKREQEMSSFETEYKKGLDSLREAQNRDFALLLAGKWIEREVTEAPPVLEKPKPETPPMVTEEKPETKPAEPMPLPEVEAEPAPEKAPLDVPQDNSLPQKTDDMSDEAPVQEDTYRQCYLGSCICRAMG
jgi:outer membrane biosynthesis protein TonB